MKESRDLSRRLFLQGGMIGAAGLAACGLLGGCSPRGDDTASSDGSTKTMDSALAAADETVECDILVCGAGASGMMAALEAAKNANGKKVICISNSSNADTTNGGNVSGTCSVQTPYTQQAGETMTTDDLYRYMIDFSHWTVNSRLLKTCVDLMPGNIEIFDDMGIQMMLGADRIGLGFRDVHLFMTENKGQVMEDYITDGYGVEFRYGTEAQAPLMDDGKLLGIRAVTDDGESIDFKAKAVCLACGGYISNADMVKETYGIEIVPTSFPYQKGLGIQIAEAAGAFHESSYGLGLTDVVAANTETGFSLDNMLLSVAQYGGLLVDANGERFMDEYELSLTCLSSGGEALLHVPRYYAVL